MISVLLLHGALGSETQLFPLKELLEEKGVIVYTINFSGHSREPFANTFGIEQFTEDVLQFLVFNNIESINIFGYSMGGYVATWLALSNPEKVKSIVTLGTKFDWDPVSAQKEVSKLNPEKIEEKVPAFARILMHRHSPELWKKLLAETSAMMLGLGEKPLLTESNLKTVQIPVTVCLGDHDDMADRQFSEYVASVLPKGKFLLFEKTHHPIEKVELDKLVDQILDVGR